MKDTIFREYDIRGKVGDELVIDEIYNLTRAIAYYFVQCNPAVKRIVVGMDGRLHSPKIKQEVFRGLVDSGLNVIFIGVCPTPTLYFALHTLPVDAGLMITASHNPKEYNGLKICMGTTSVWGEQIQEIKRLYRANKCVATHVKGEVSEYSIIDEYVNYLVKQFHDLIDMQLKVVIDCGNGSAGTVLPQLVEKMKWKKVQLLYPEVDGTYPHHEADPTVEENMQEVKRILKTTDTELGIGLDGDCDRMAPMTKNGELVPGDKLLAIFAQELLKNNPRASIVFDIKSSSGLIELLQQWGGKPHMSPSGHAIIKEQMEEKGALLGGELSCHFFFKDRNFGYDDGIYAMLRLFEIVTKSGKTLSELLEIFPKKYSTREFRIACPEEKKHVVIQAIKKLFSERSDVDTMTIDGVRVSMNYGWGIVRASNTQPVLSLRFESDSREGLERVKQDFMKALIEHFPEDVLKELNN